MISIETKLRAADNVGVIVGKCIHVYGSFYKKTFARLGSKILISARKKNYLKNIKKKVHQAVVVRTKKPVNRKNGHSLSCFSNNFITLHQDGSYRGTVFNGPAFLEMNFLKTIELGRLTTKLI